MRPAERFDELSPSHIRQVLDRAAELEADGARVVHLEIGQPDFDTPSFIKDATSRAMADGHVGYGPTAGMRELREAIAERLSGINRTPQAWSADRILITNGAIEAIYVALAAVLDPGDEVLTIEPGWTNYASMITVCGGVPRAVGTSPEEGFQPDPDRIAGMIGPRTRALILNSPNNPTGATVSDERLRAIARIAHDHDLLVISDEVYDAIHFTGAAPTSIASLPGMLERTVVVNAFSKTYAMTGWRLGYAALPAIVARQAILAHAFINTSINTFIQYGALAALRHGDDDVARMVAAYTERRALALERLATMPGVRVTPSDGTFFLFPRLTGHDDDRALALGLLEDAHVATIPGSAFGPSGRGHLRLSIATDTASLEEGLERLRAYLAGSA